MRRIILVGGGSAGHVEPALAVSDSITEIDNSIKCEILGTGSLIENRLVANRGFELKSIPKVALPRRINLAALRFPISIVSAVFAARKVIRGASALVGFGGYVSAAGYLAAKSLGIPIVVHEANAKPGWANRLGRHLATSVAVNFKSLEKTWPGSIHTGMPIKDSILEIANWDEAERYANRARTARDWGFDPKLPIIAIFGGSLGSIRINSAVAQFLASDQSELQIIHSVGLNNPLPERTARYLPLPYFDDMAKIYASSDLVISRSGAVTCSELLVTGRFAILVPLAHGNGEQTKNAEALVERGVATIVRDEEFTGIWLRENLSKVIAQVKSHKQVSDPTSLGAARKIAELALKEVAL